MTSPSPFQLYAEKYRARGLWPRPVQIGSKKCPLKGWQHPDDQLPPGALDRWLYGSTAAGIGLVTGSPLPDGTKLTALDIDRNEYVRVAQALLQDPVCARIGAKGIVIFARLRGDGKYRQFVVKGRDGDPDKKLGELLCDKRFCVIPPTIHPDTDQPYRWVGKSLLEIDFRDLPLIEAYDDH